MSRPNRASLTKYSKTKVAKEHLSQKTKDKNYSETMLGYSSVFVRLYSLGTAVSGLVSHFCLLKLLYYYFFFRFHLQAFEPWIQDRRVEFVLQKYVRKNLLQSLLTAGRRPDFSAIRE